MEDDSDQFPNGFDGEIGKIQSFEGILYDPEFVGLQNNKTWSSGNRVIKSIKSYLKVIYQMKYPSFCLFV